MEQALIDEALDRLTDALAEHRVEEAREKAVALIAEGASSALLFSMLGAAEAQLGQFGSAAEAFSRARSLEPDDPAIAYNCGRAWLELKNHAKAIEHFTAAVQVAPDYVAAHYNLGLALFNLGQLDQAVSAFEKTLALDPDHAAACNNTGTVLSDLGRLEDAAEMLARAIALDPARADARHNLAMVQLQQGQFAQGWAGYEWRKRLAEPHGDRVCAAELWLGQASLHGKSLFIHAEQGLGDTLQFIRYAPLARAMGAKVTVAAPDTLHPLLQPALPGITLVSAKAPEPECDFHCPMLSLPLAFGTRLETIPASPAYLAADRERVRHWDNRLGHHGFRIGVCWQGQTRGPNEGRFFPLPELRGIAAMPGARLISLHKGSGEQDLAGLDGMTVETLGAFDPPGAAFVDTAAVIALCDLVITADTSVAHLAGALGAPVWVVLQAVPEWRWLLDRCDTPWYPSMRLFRQQRRGDWRSAFVEVERALGQVLATTRDPAPVAMPWVPAAWGEVFDKISILEIKLVEAAEPAARANVAFELSRLQATVAAGLGPVSGLDALRDALAAVNRRLWDSEDRIRLKETEGAFDAEFVELARTVYRTNDRRSELKRQINRLTSSTIQEEKIFTAPGLAGAG